MAPGKSVQSSLASSKTATESWPRPHTFPDSDERRTNGGRDDTDLNAQEHTANLQTQWLGRLRYDDALALQDTLVQQRVVGEIGDRLLLLEHEPVYTIGRTPDQS